MAEKTKTTFEKDGTYHRGGEAVHEIDVSKTPTLKDPGAVPPVKPKSVGLGAPPAPPNKGKPAGSFTLADLRRSAKTAKEPAAAKPLETPADINLGKVDTANTGTNSAAVEPEPMVEVEPEIMPTTQVEQPEPVVSAEPESVPATNPVEQPEPVVSAEPESVPATKPAEEPKSEETFNVGKMESTPVKSVNLRELRRPSAAAEPPVTPEPPASTVTPEPPMAPTAEDVHAGFSGKGYCLIDLQRYLEISSQTNADLVAIGKAYNKARRLEPAIICESASDGRIRCYGYNLSRAGTPRYVFGFGDQITCATLDFKTGKVSDVSSSFVQNNSDIIAKQGTAVVIYNQRIRKTKRV